MIVKLVKVFPSLKTAKELAKKKANYLSAFADFIVTFEDGVALKIKGCRFTIHADGKSFLKMPVIPREIKKEHELTDPILIAKQMKAAIQEAKDKEFSPVTFATLEASESFKAQAFKEMREKCPPDQWGKGPWLASGLGAANSAPTSLRPILGAKTEKKPIDTARYVDLPKPAPKRY